MTIPIIELTLDTKFNKNSIFSILSKAQETHCKFYVLKTQQINQEELSINAATIYLSDPSNQEPNNRSILIAHNSNTMRISLFADTSNFLTIRLSLINTKADLEPCVLFLLEITEAVPIFAMNTLKDDTSCY